MLKGSSCNHGTGASKLSLTKAYGLLSDLGSFPLSQLTTCKPVARGQYGVELQSWFMLQMVTWSNDVANTG
jgi:hypothetical protein